MHVADTFQRGQGMDQLKQTVQAISSAFADAGALGTFAENHVRASPSHLGLGEVFS